MSQRVVSDRKAASGSSAPTAGQVGRPRRELAGEVEARVLDAARQVFLDRGLGGATIDEIARVARAGKATIYARFETKEALFREVAMRSAARVRSGFEAYEPTGATLQDRLVNTAAEMLRRLLQPEVLDFMRLCIAEARRFPEVAGVGRMVRDGAVQAVAKILFDVTRTDDVGISAAFGPERLSQTAEFFMDVVIERLLMRGLFGEDPASLRAEIDARVVRGVTLFLAACRSA